MTSEGVQNVLDSAQLIGDNVYNFYPKYKKYETIFEVNGSTVDREEIKIKYKPEILKIYDQVMFLKKNLDIVTICSSAMQMFDSERYDYVNAKIIANNLVLVDRQSGDTCYMACDQINTMVRFDKDATAAMIDEKTGERLENVKINENKVRESLFYHS